LRARHKARCAAADDCKKRLKDLRIRAKNNEALRRTAADPVAHRAYLLRASLIDSVRKRAAAAA